MRHRTVSPVFRSLTWPCVLLLTAFVAAGAWFAPAGAQDASPEPVPGASPIPGAGQGDCTQPLGLPSGIGCVNVIHAAATAGPVDVYVDGQPILTNVAFGTASGYMALPPGLHQVQLVPAGGDLSAAVVTAQTQVEAGNAYEVAAIAGVEPVQVVATTANLDPLGEGVARVRVFQAIAGAPPSDLALPEGEVAIPNITPGAATEYAEIPVAAGAPPPGFEVRVAGIEIDIPVSGEQLDAVIDPGFVYTFYILGTVTDLGSFQVLPVVAPAAGSAGVGSAATPAAALPLAVGTPQASPVP